MPLRSLIQVGVMLWPCEAVRTERGIITAGLGGPENMGPECQAHAVARTRGMQPE